MTFRNHSSNCNWDFWLGFYDSTGNGLFEWVNSVSSTPLQWSAGFPTCFYTPSASVAKSSFSAKFFNVNLSNYFPFHCQLRLSTRKDIEVYFSCETN